MNLAKELVKIVQNSQDFTLTEYPGQQEFYDKYMEYWDILKEDMEDQKCANMIDDELNSLASSGTLSLYHLLAAYVMALCTYDLTWLPRCTCTHYYNNNSLEYCSKGFKKNKAVPFLSKSGTYGFNTFLYLYFNDLSPVGVSKTPYPVHSNLYRGRPCDTTNHDVEHVVKIYSQGYDKYYDLYIALKNMYYYIMTNQEEFDREMLEMYLIIMFIVIHEETMLHNVYTEDYKGLLSNMYKIIEEFLFRDNDLGRKNSYFYSIYNRVDAYMIHFAIIIIIVFFTFLESFIPSANYTLTKKINNLIIHFENIYMRMNK